MLLPGFRKQPNVKILAPGREGPEWIERVARYKPHCVAGSPSQLPFLTAVRRARNSPLACVQHSLIVVFQAEAPWLDDRDRDELWSAFGIPVYAQIYGSTGLLASECEAHFGLHIVKGCEWIANGRNVELAYREPIAWWEERGAGYSRSGLFGSIDTARCNCGRTSPRLHVAGPVCRDAIHSGA